MKHIIKTILAEWKGKNIPSVISRETNIQTYLNMKVNKILVLNGFRRVGKTYILYGLVNELLKFNSREEVVQINFEDERIPLQTEFLSSLLPTAEEILQKVSDFRLQVSEFSIQSAIDNSQFEMMKEGANT